MASRHLGKKKIGFYVEDSKALPSSLKSNYGRFTITAPTHATAEPLVLLTHSVIRHPTTEPPTKASTKSRHLRHSKSTSEATAISATHSWESADTAKTSAKSRHLWHPITTEATAATP
jgi:hypothetical protein